MRKELYRLWLWLAAPQQLHYINGADTLPPPLPPEQEREALAALARGQTPARDLLITHNLRHRGYDLDRHDRADKGGQHL